MATGATIVVRKGTRYAMTKVASDGYDIEDHAPALKRFAKTANNPEDVTKEYLRLRSVSQLGCADFDPYNPLGPDEELCRFVREYEDQPDPEEALDRMEDELNSNEDLEDEHPYSQLGCSYIDHFAFFDMDSGEAFVDDEEV